MRGIAVGLVVLLAACAQQGQGGGGNEPAAAPTEEAPSGPEEITVKAVEYEFQGMPATLTPGRTALLLENAGEEPHQMSIALITSDATVEELLGLPENQVNEQIEDVGNLFARPGDSQRRVVDLAPGRYGFVCFVSTKESMGPHAFEGMFGEFTVA